MKKTTCKQLKQLIRLQIIQRDNITASKAAELGWQEEEDIAWQMNAMCDGLFEYKIRLQDVSQLVGNTEKKEYNRPNNNKIVRNCRLRPFKSPKILSLLIITSVKHVHPHRWPNTSTEIQLSHCTARTALLEYRHNTTMQTSWDILRNNGIPSCLMLLYWAWPLAFSLIINLGLLILPKISCLFPCCSQSCLRTSGCEPFWNKMTPHDHICTWSMMLKYKYLKMNPA